MGFFKRAWNRIFRSQVYVLGENDADFLKALGIDPEAINVKGKNALKVATVFASIRILSDAVAKLPLKTYRSEDGKQSDVNHYLTPLLRLRPNPFMSAIDFFKALESQRNLYGNSYAWIETGRNGKIEALYPLQSDRVTIVIDDVGLLNSTNRIWYIVTDENGRQYKLHQDEILHFKGMTTDGLVGISVIDYLKSTVENASASTDFLNNSFKNGMQVKGIVEYVGDLNPEAIENFKTKFESMSNGLKNANRVALLPVGYKFQPISLNMVDAQFLENTQLTIKQIAAAFGIKMHQLNDLDRATHTNISEQQRDFYIDTLMSILTMYEQEMTYKLFLKKELEQGYYLKFNVNAILRADIKTRYEAYQTAIQSGFMTPNEVRRLEEREDKEGGDRLLVNGNMVPIEDAGAAYRKRG